MLKMSYKVPRLRVMFYINSWLILAYLALVLFVHQRGTADMAQIQLDLRELQKSLHSRNHTEPHTTHQHLDPQPVQSWNATSYMNMAGELTEESLGTDYQDMYPGEDSNEESKNSQSVLPRAKPDGEHRRDSGHMTQDGSVRIVQDSQNQKALFPYQKYDADVLYQIDVEREQSLAIKGGVTDYLPNYRNPCWVSKLNTTMPYHNGLYKGRREKQMYKILQDDFEAQQKAVPGKVISRLRCLPLVYIIGVTKSGTSDLFEKLMLHPMLLMPGRKEPLWWNGYRYARHNNTFSEYLDLFDYAGKTMSLNTLNKSDVHPGLTVDGSPNYLWNYDGWWRFPVNAGQLEPRFTVAHSIRRLVPGARLIVILREPADRLFSQFRMWSGASYGPEVFHDLVVQALTHMRTCLAEYSLRTCVYYHSRRFENKRTKYGTFIERGLRLRASMYYPFVRDWLDVFPRDQLHVIKAEDYYENRATTLNQVFKYLGLPSLSAQELEGVDSSRIVNRSKVRKSSPMLPETRQLLREFLRPYNQALARLLDDTRFMWQELEDR